MQFRILKVLRLVGVQPAMVMISLAIPHCLALEMVAPLDGTVVPRDMAPITFRWQDHSQPAERWSITLKFADQNMLQFMVDKPEWTPAPGEWETIKQKSLERTAQVVVRGLLQGNAPPNISEDRISFTTSQDPVEAPIFYREIALPFIEAARDPSQIRWRLGSVATSGPPPVIMEKIPVCANCHSFSQSGDMMAMDVDYRGKGDFVINPVEREIVLQKSGIFSWDLDHSKSKTSGLLAQLSPDGQWMVSTVADKSIILADGLAFSQNLIPFQGKLGLYHRATKSFRTLPGADREEFVQTNPVWGPDGQSIVFARAKTPALKKAIPPDKIMLRWYDVREFSDRELPEIARGQRPFAYDLYRVPFNQGRGGEPEPLIGASHNGRSNFFPRYSPDGKWIVFCQARSGLMLQPDSELYIIPAQGGTARRLQGNTARMNSWHSWSPNSRWLVFSSKAHSPYTQLCLTHIDEQGHSSPPLFLAHFSEPDRAANLPEFVNLAPGALTQIRQQFAEDVACVRAGNEFMRSGDAEEAIREYQKALTFNPENVQAQQRLGVLLFYVQGKAEPALEHLAAAARLAPKNPYIHFDLGTVWLGQGQLERAVEHLNEALLRLTNGVDDEYNPADTQYKLGMMLSPRHARYRIVNPVVDVQYTLGLALFLQEAYAASATVLRQAVAREARHNADVHYLLAWALAANGQGNAALEHRDKAHKLKAGIDTLPELYEYLGINHTNAQRFRKAIVQAETALKKIGETAGLKRPHLILGSHHRRREKPET